MINVSESQVIVGIKMTNEEWEALYAIVGKVVEEENNNYQSSIYDRRNLSDYEFSNMMARKNAAFKVMGAVDMVRSTSS